MDKKEVIRAIRYLEKSIKNKEHDIIHCTTSWNGEYYEETEIAARYLCRKGYNIKVISQFSWHLQYLFGYARLSRHVIIKY